MFEGWKVAGWAAADGRGYTFEGEKVTGRKVGRPEAGVTGEKVSRSAGQKLTGWSGEARRLRVGTLNLEPVNLEPLNLAPWRGLNQRGGG
jgi:hypothetical protein